MRQYLQPGCYKLNLWLLGHICLAQKLNKVERIVRHDETGLGLDFIACSCKEANPQVAKVEYISLRRVYAKYKILL